MSYNYPWTNLHEINLDWLLDKAKKFFTNIKQPTASAQIAGAVGVTVTGDGIDSPYNFHFDIPSAIEVDTAYPRIIDTCNPPVITGLAACVGDGVEDDTVNLQAIIDYAIANKWAVQLTGRHRVTSTVTIDGCIDMRGLGGNYANYDQTIQSDTSKIASGIILDGDGIALDIPGRVEGVHLANFAIHHLGSGYSMGLSVHRLRHSVIEQLTISYFSRGLSVVVDNGVEYANDNCMFNTFRDINLNRCGMNSSTAMYLDGFTGNLYGGNVCHCLFERINIENLNMGLDLADCDNNTFIDIRVYNRPGSDWACRMLTGCRTNFMYHVQLPTCLTETAGNNYINGYSYENGEQAPYAVPGSTGTLTVVDVLGQQTQYTG